MEIVWFDFVFFGFILFAVASYHFILFYFILFDGFAPTSKPVTKDCCLPYDAQNEHARPPSTYVRDSNRVGLRIFAGRNRTKKISFHKFDISLFFS